VTVELRYAPGCPHVARSRRLLRTCLAADGRDDLILEREGDFPSPSVLIDGVDVMGAVEANGPSCRLDLPTQARILAALRGQPNRP
jgi:hypothetical protein